MWQKNIVNICKNQMLCLCPEYMEKSYTAITKRKPSSSNVVRNPGPVLHGRKSKRLINARSGDQHASSQQNGLKPAHRRQRGEQTTLQMGLGREVARPPPRPDGHWLEPCRALMGPAKASAVSAGSGPIARSDSGQCAAAWPAALQMGHAASETGWRGRRCHFGGRAVGRSMDKCARPRTTSG